MILSTSVNTLSFSPQDEKEKMITLHYNTNLPPTQYHFYINLLLGPGVSNICVKYIYFRKYLVLGAQPSPAWQWVRVALSPQSLIVRSLLWGRPGQRDRGTEGREAGRRRMWHSKATCDSPTVCHLPPAWSTLLLLSSDCLQLWDYDFQASQICQLQSPHITRNIEGKVFILELLMFLWDIGGLIPRNLTSLH